MARSPHEIFEVLEQQKAAILKRCDGWSAQRLAFQPEPTSWSALQMFDHIVKIDEAFPRVVRASLPSRHFVSPVDTLKSYMVIRVMRSPRRVRVPAGAKAVLPSAHCADLPELVERWTRIRLDIARLLNEVTPDQRSIGAFHHPIGGWMNITRALDFLASHVQHHDFQLSRLQEASAGL